MKMKEYTITTFKRNWNTKAVDAYCYYWKNNERKVDVFPIHYSVKRQPECYRVLFEYFNGELYQIDMEDSIYNALEEKEIIFFTQ